MDLLNTQEYWNKIIAQQDQEEADELAAEVEQNLKSNIEAACELITEHSEFIPSLYEIRLELASWDPIGIHKWTIEEIRDIISIMIQDELNKPLAEHEE